MIWRYIAVTLLGRTDDAQAMDKKYSWPEMSKTKVPLGKAGVWVSHIPLIYGLNMIPRSVLIDFNFPYPIIFSPQ